jgi:uncharacterized protein (DUF427 family)
MTLQNDRSEQAGYAWRYTGQSRPPFAATPEPGQESVWDYPRPPRLAPDGREVLVRIGELEIARTKHAIRVLETASPPTFYLPQADCRDEYLEATSGRSWCEWKGEARYWSILVPGGRLERVAWSYHAPRPGFEPIAGYIAFYPDGGGGRLVCTVDGIRVLPQPGRFYGGWITPELVGPFKGGPGSEGW